MTDNHSARALVQRAAQEHFSEDARWAREQQRMREAGYLFGSDEWELVRMGWDRARAAQ